MSGEDSHILTAAADFVVSLFLNFAFTFSKMESRLQNKMSMPSNSAVTLQLWPSKFLISRFLICSCRFTEYTINVPVNTDFAGALLHLIAWLNNI